MSLRQEDLNTIHEEVRTYDEDRERVRPISQEQLGMAISNIALREVSLNYLVKYSDSPFINRGGDYGGSHAKLVPPPPEGDSGAVELDLPIAA